MALESSWAVLPQGAEAGPVANLTLEGISPAGLGRAPLLRHQECLWDILHAGCFPEHPAQPVSFQVPALSPHPPGHYFLFPGVLLPSHLAASGKRDDVLCLKELTGSAGQGGLMRGSRLTLTL